MRILDKKNTINPARKMITTTIRTIIISTVVVIFLHCQPSYCGGVDIINNNNNNNNNDNKSNITTITTTPTILQNDHNNNNNNNLATAERVAAFIHDHLSRLDRHPPPPPPHHHLHHQHQSLNLVKIHNKTTLVPNNNNNNSYKTASKNLTTISQIFKHSFLKDGDRNVAQRRQDDDGNGNDGGDGVNEDGQQSFIKSLIPTVPFKKPIKKIFRSWFEPDPEALNDDSPASTFYFTRGKPNIPLPTAPSSVSSSRATNNNNNNNNNNNALKAEPSVNHANRILAPPPKHHNFINLGQYSGSYGKHVAPQYGQKKVLYAQNPVAASGRQQKFVSPQQTAQQRQFAIGDPANGRGISISFGDQPQSSEPSYASAPTSDQMTQMQPSGGGGGGGGHRGISFSFGGRNGGGSGMSLNLGRGNSEGRGLSLSLGGGGGSGGDSGGGGGGGGSGLSFSFGGGGAPTISAGGATNSYKQSGSSSYPSYSNYGSKNNYGSSYGNNYGYSNNYDYYPQQPIFSMVMPSPGKTVMEMNQHPPRMKMKINSSPRVKIITNTKDPLDKPGLEDEVIQEDIFGPPAPFDIPGKNGTGTNETMMNGMNMTTPLNQTMMMMPYPYPPYYMYPSYMYQNPYDYYYNYYQQQYPYYSYMNQSMPSMPSMYPANHQSPSMPMMPMPPMAPMAQSPHPPPPPPAPTPSKPPQQYGYPYGSYSASHMSQPASPMMNGVSMYNPAPPSSSAYSASSNSYVVSSRQPNRNNPTQTSGYHQAYGTYSQPMAAAGSSATVGAAWQPTGLTGQQQQQQQQQVVSASYQIPSHHTTMMDKGFNAYKRSSASRNYQKDMLTLGTNSIATYSRRKPLYSLKRNSVIPTQRSYSYSYDPMMVGESQTYPQYGMRMAQQLPPAPANLTVMNPITMAMAMNPGSVWPYGQTGTGAGYSFFNTTSTYNKTNWSPYNYYYNPYYYNYYKNYYNYAKKYYDTYYGNSTGYYPRKNKTSITGFSQNSFDYTQSKIFGSRTLKYPGGQVKEEKARIILDVRPRVSIKMLNKTEQMMQDEELRKKKKDHIFKTHMEVIMVSSTTPKPYDNSYYNSYYGYNYGPEEDDFGWTHEPAYATTSTTPKPKPKTTTTRRRTTTTEGPSSSEVSEEDTSEPTSEETISDEEDDQRSSSTTTTEATDVEEASGEEGDEMSSREMSTTTTTSTTASTPDSFEDGGGEAEEEEVIGEGEDSENSEKSVEDGKTDDEEGKTDDEEGGKTTSTAEEANSGEEKDNETGDDDDDDGGGEDKPSMEDGMAKTNNITVAPELVAAMIRALQEALGVTTTTTTTTPMPISTLQSLDEDRSNEEDAGDSLDNDIGTSTTPFKRAKTTSKPKIRGERRRQPTNVITTTVRNTTQVRLKSPVLNIHSRTTAASNLVRHRVPSSSSSSSSSSSATTTTTKSNTDLNGRKPKKAAPNSDEETIMEEFDDRMVTQMEDLTTTSPFIIVNKVSKTSSSSSSDVRKVIDGDAFLNNFDINNLTDDERRDMLTNILEVIQSRSTSALSSLEPVTVTSSTTPMANRKAKSKKKFSAGKTGKSLSLSSKTTTMPKVNNVKIITSLDELNKDSSNPDKSATKTPPIYVVLLPQNKKKK